MQQMKAVKVAMIVWFIVILLIPEPIFAAEEYSIDWLALFARWLPWVVIIGVWIYILRSPKLNTQYQEANRHLEKIEQALERIAQAMEKK